jgi:CRISPR-associated protein Csd2
MKEEKVTMAMSTKKATNERGKRVSTIEDRRAATALQNKIDFALVISVNHANPNGDPLDGNRPRTTFDGFGEMTDVCLKRKIRNRLQDAEQAIFVQSDDRRSDNFRSLEARANSVLKGLGKEEYIVAACQTWLDVRSFGQVFAFKDDDDSTSISIRGPVTIQSAFSVEPVEIRSLQITKSVNAKTPVDKKTKEEKPDNKSPDTMGMKHRVDKGIYVAYGSINMQLAEKTGFSEADADILKDAMSSMFVNDASSARPDGSMEVLKLVWWKHNCKNGQYSSAQVHRSLKVNSDGSIKLEQLDGLVPEVIDGL